MNELLNATLQQAEENRIIKGMVLEVRQTEVLIDVGGKSEGSVPANEFEDIASVKVGQEVEARIVRIDRDARRIGLSLKAQGGEDEDFEIPAEYAAEQGLRADQNIVGLASAFDEAFSTTEEWTPGEKKSEE